MKNIMVQVVVIVFTLSGIAQSQFLRSYGVKVAYTSASQGLSYPFDVPGWWVSSQTSAISGLNIAAFAEWLDLHHLSFISQIEYDQHGANLQYTINGEPASTRGSLSYLSVPILAKIKIPTGSVSPYVIAGPRADFLLSYTDFQIQPRTYPVYSKFKKWMLGGSMGVGLETGALLPANLLVELRYNWDFSDSYSDGFVKIGTLDRCTAFVFRVVSVDRHLRTRRPRLPSSALVFCRCTGDFAAPPLRHAVETQTAGKRE